MAGILRNDSTVEGRAIRNSVNKAASKAPEWAKHKTENAPMRINQNREKSLLTVRSSR